MIAARSRLSPCVAALLLGFSASLFAGQAELDRALAQYYAGQPAQAISLLESLARAGDVDAQYLLGNMLYALAQSGQGAVSDPVAWYEMAAARGHAEAGYALGSIYHNNWLESRAESDAALAEAYFQRAFDLGYQKAQGPLLKLAARNRGKRRGNSLTYTNSSFASKQAPLTTQADKPAPSVPASDALASFELSGDPIADAAKLEALLARINQQVGGTLPDAATLTRLLSSFGGNSGIVSNLVDLLGELQSASESN